MDKQTRNKNESLGMNHSTASGRLLKDILFNFISENDTVCYHCEKEMTRDNFSIEHIVPWLYAENALELFFDLSNISFSHLKCNVSKRRIPNAKNRSIEEMRKVWSLKGRRNYTAEKRRQKYIRKGY